MLNNKSGFALIAFSSTSIILLGGLIAFFGISLFNSILDLSITFNKPIGNGVITANNMSQARQRCDSRNINKPNKGSEAANAVMSILENGPKKI